MEQAQGLEANALSQSTNILRSKWVLKWKEIEGSRQIKGRMVAQGFLDKQSTLTFSGTTSRWGQRIVMAVATQMGWDLLSADVSEAFLRGITFEELAKNDPTTPLRVVELELPPGTAELLRTLPGMETFDPGKECLSLLKPGFGLKDAPRLWNMALLRVLSKAGLHRCQTDRQLFVKHDVGKLVLLVSTHVDDLKITGLQRQMQALMSCLTGHFDELKTATDNFEHLGLKHTKNEDGTRQVSQDHYVSELKHVPEGGLKSNLDEPVNDAVRTKFSSLLGGLAWVTQTRLDVAVFVAALQRKLKAPTNRRDVINLNRVLSYIKRKPLGLTYVKLEDPWKLYVISDSSFKGEGQDALAMRSGIIALGSKSGPVVGRNSLQVLEFVSKKQSRVCRSTFTAELYSMLDLLGLASNINLAMTEVLTGCKSASELAAIQENGQNTLELLAFLDARSVYDCVAAADTKSTTDQMMLIHALKLKDCLALRLVSNLFWIDTRDMLADGLNKGIVSREALQELCSRGLWMINHPMQVHEEPRQSRVTAEPESKGTRPDEVVTA